MNLSVQKSAIYSLIFSVAFILFWLFAAGSKIYDLPRWKNEMDNQIFSEKISSALVYVVPATEVIIAVLLVYSASRLTGVVMTSLLIAQVYWDTTAAGKPI